MNRVIALSPDLASQALRARVESAFVHADPAWASDLILAVTGDAVSIVGTVGSIAELSAATAQAWSVPGVRSVRARLRVSRKSADWADPADSLETSDPAA